MERVNQMRMKALPAGLALGLALVAMSPAGVWPAQQTMPRCCTATPSPEQLQSLFARVVENQHRNDAALEEYERTEHEMTRKGDETSPVLSDRTNRVIPSGVGIMRLQVAEKGVPVSSEVHRHNLQIAVDALERAIHPNEHQRQDRAKFEKRRRDRAELVDTAKKAFRVTWGGRETRGTRTLAKLVLDPDPNYRGSTRVGEVFQHVRAVLWVDEAESQIARAEGDVTSDITFGGGILGKVYRGGHFVMEQAEVSAGTWLPTLYIYDVDGRKFLFGFGVHERTEVSGYRHLGQPAQAIEVLRTELNNLSAKTPAK